jgi:hypothetical protein
VVRGSREFESIEAWQSFVDQVARKANLARGPRVREELEAMRKLDVTKLPEFTEEEVKVSEWSTIRVKHCAYSVPSRLVGHFVKVRVYEDRIEVEFADKLELACERLMGRNRHRIDYRLVIWSLVQKPGAFARYVYREEMFPSLVFRRAYDAIQTPHHGTKGDLEYLRILHLAASTLEADVEVALELLLTEKAKITADSVKILVSGAARVDVPALARPTVDLESYDALLEEVAS